MSKGTKSETSGYLLDNSSVGLEYVVCDKGPQDDKLRKSQSKVLAAWWMQREPSAEGTPGHARLLRAAHTPLTSTPFSSSNPKRWPDHTPKFRQRINKGLN